MASMCTHLGLKATMLPSISCNPGYYGCSIGHLRALFDARENKRLPALILENDCAHTKRFQPIIEVPKNSDIVYLGNSSCGCVPELNNRGVRGCALVSEVEGNDQFYRTDNMAATHAILYVTEKALDDAIESTVKSLSIARAIDVGFILELQPTLNVYNFKIPLFYQAEKLQGNKEIAPIMQRMTLNETPQPRSDGTLFNYRSDNPKITENTVLELVAQPDRPPQVWKIRRESSVEVTELG